MHYIDLSAIADAHPQTQKGKRQRNTVLCAFFLLCFLGSLPSIGLAQVYRPLQMVRPVAVGPAGTGLDTNNRVYRAYPGIEYNIHADAIGGRWPYTYSLSNAPAGMTIEPGPCTTIGPSCMAGTIRWTPSATGTYGPITVTVRDQNGTIVTGTWSITVTNRIGADGFCFLDAVSGNDTTGTGSLSAPYRTLARAHSSCGARSIIYFKNGTYTFPRSIFDARGDRVEWGESLRGVIWIAFPGHHPIIDFEADGSRTNLFFVNVQGANMWFDGLEIRRVHSQGFRLQNRVNLYGAVIRRITAVDLLEGRDGENSSFFMWTTCADCTSKFDTVQNSSFSNILSEACALKLYAVENGIFETSTYANYTVANEAILAIKGGQLPNETVRANIMTDRINTGIGGNMTNFSGEVYHNLVIQSTTPNAANGTLTLGVALVHPLRVVRVYRNTFVGQVNISWLQSTNGPYYFDGNVIVNSGGSGGSCPQRLACYNSTSGYDKIVMGQNLQGRSSDNIVDSAGRLQGNYRTQWLGLRGYELASTSEATSDSTPPIPPQNLQIAF